MKTKFNATAAAAATTIRHQNSLANGFCRYNREKIAEQANRIYEMENGRENAKLRVNTGIKYYRHIITMGFIPLTIVCENCKKGKVIFTESILGAIILPQQTN